MTAHTHAHTRLHKHALAQIHMHAHAYTHIVRWYLDAAVEKRLKGSYTHMHAPAHTNTRGFTVTRAHENEMVRS